MKAEIKTSKGRYLFEVEGIFISSESISITFRFTKYNRHYMSFNKVNGEFVRTEVMGEREVLKDIYIDKEKILF